MNRNNDVEEQRNKTKEHRIIGVLLAVAAALGLAGAIWSWKTTPKPAYRSIPGLPAGACKKGEGPRFFKSDKKEIMALVLETLKTGDQKALAKMASCDFAISSQLSPGVLFILPEKAMDEVSVQLKDVAWNFPEMPDPNARAVSSNAAAYNYILEFTEFPGKGWAWSGLQTSDDALFKALARQSFDTNEPIEEIEVPESQEDVPE